MRPWRSASATVSVPAQWRPGSAAPAARCRRGGWTWYTGSAAWLYRAGLEALLGFHLRGDRLRVEPCIPKAWPGFHVRYRHRGTLHEIEVQNPDHVCRGVLRVEMDGQTLDAAEPVTLATDGATHHLRITLGHPPA